MASAAMKFAVSSHAALATAPTGAEECPRAVRMPASRQVRHLHSPLTIKNCGRRDAAEACCFRRIQQLSPPGPRAPPGSFVACCSNSRFHSSCSPAAGAAAVACRPRSATVAAAAGRGFGASERQGRQEPNGSTPGDRNAAATETDAAAEQNGEAAAPAAAAETSYSQRMEQEWQRLQQEFQQLKQQQQRQRQRRRETTGGAEGDEEDDPWDLSDFARPAERAWSLDNPQVYYFAIANAHSLLNDGALVEEVLADAISRANRGGRPRDVWMVMEPAFLDHPSLASLKAVLKKPTAAILSTNGPWMMSTVRELLPQATIGKLYAPTKALPNPFLSNVESGGAVIGGGAVWH